MNQTGLIKMSGVFKLQTDREKWSLQSEDNLTTELEFTQSAKTDTWE